MSAASYPLILILCIFAAHVNGWMSTSPAFSGERWSRTLAGRKKSTLSMKMDGRRQALVGIAVGVGSLWPSQAKASYSAYVAREKDWDERLSKKEVKVSTASDLKRQLREIVPENEKAEIFCPNGPSSAVSALMENRCGDRLASVSVYGSTQDVVGNTIPGARSGYQSPAQRGKASSLASTTNLASSAGGFLDYGGAAGSQTKLVPRR